MEEASSNNARRHVRNDDSATTGRDSDEDEPDFTLSALKDDIHVNVFTRKLIDGLDWARHLCVTGPLLDMMSSSWLNALLVFVPVGLASYVIGLGPVYVFGFNAAAIVPLSALLTDATERVAAHAGDTVGALLNISLGNLTTDFSAALAHNHVGIVQGSILGSVLVNLLLILGSALVVGSAADGEPSSYNAADAQLLACLLSVSVFTFLMPTAFNYTFSPEARSSGLVSLKLSRISSLLILAIYVLYLTHEIRSRCRRVVVIVDLESNISAAEQDRLPPPLLPMSIQPLPPRTIRFVDDPATDTNRERHCSNLHPHHHHHRGRRLAESRLGLRPRADSWQPSRKLSPSPSFLSRHSSSAVNDDEDVRRGFPRSSLTLQMLKDVHHIERDEAVDGGVGSSGASNGSSEIAVAISMLVLTSGLMSINAELLVGTIDEVTRQTNLSESVIGLILLPIVGNVAEYVTVVAVAARKKLDLAIAVAVGSSIQIALCVTPLTVLAGWMLHKDLALTFNTFEVATLVGAVLLVNLLILNETGSSLRTGSLKGILILKVNLEILEQAIVEAKDISAHDGIPVPRVGLLHSGGLNDIATLLLHIELHQPLVTAVIVGYGVELGLVKAVDVADVAQPRVEKPQVLGRHGRLDAAAAVVAADDDLLDGQVTDGVVDDAHHVEVGVADQIGDVAMDKGLARLEAGDELGGDPGVAAADPEEFGGLAGREAGEEARVAQLLIGGPGAVVLEKPVVAFGEFVGVGHGG
ncbi:hypothetical protein CP532_5486 [Ophiocordyceps camponoti-leonardi (nom. inval.)]|nr:hypothetical protein CP532_5486 [Ophiocordyceps camponoti-leonardi (nom. inval.)]